MKITKKLTKIMFVLIILVISTSFASAVCPKEIDTSRELRSELRTIVLNYLADPDLYLTDPNSGYTKAEILNLLNFYKNEKGKSLITDCDTSGATTTLEKTIVFTWDCNDGYDNDGDGFIDFPDDYGCKDPKDNDEFNLPAPVLNSINPLSGAEDIPTTVTLQGSNFVDGLDVHIGIKATVKSMSADTILVDTNIGSAGDVNGDGFVNAADNQLIADHLLGGPQLTDAQKVLADVRGDGTVTNVDRQVILMYYSRLIGSFPICAKPAAISVDIPLVLGDNYIGIPVQFETFTRVSDLAKMITDQDGEVSAIKIFRGGFFTWTPQAPTTNNFQLISGRGYVVQVSTAPTNNVLRISGLPFTKELPFNFVDGNNLISLPFIPSGGYDTVSFAQAVQDAGGQVSAIQRWDVGTQGWIRWSSASPAANVFTLDTTSGYLITLAQATTAPVDLTPPCGSFGIVNVVVTNPDGQSDRKVSAFTYNPPPTVTSVSPAGGVINSVTAVTIKGSNFLGTPTLPTVTFNGVAATSINLVDANTITLNTPAINAYGPVNVVVTNPDGQSFTLTDGFTYAHPTGRVFVTSSPYNGNLGGISGADAKCKALADTADPAPLGGTWRAWLSDSTVDAKDRIFDREYKLVDDTGTIVTDSLTGLLDGNLDSPINVDQSKNTINSGWVWTGTLSNGIFESRSCDNSDWMDTPGGAMSGELLADSKWTNYIAFACSTRLRLYCFETTYLPPFLSLSVNPSSVPADGATISTITATTSDRKNNVVISFSSDKADTLSSSTCTTAADGKCSVTVNSFTVGTSTITASASGYVDETIPVSFTNIIPTADPITFPDSDSNKKGSTITLQCKVADVNTNDNPVKDKLTVKVWAGQCDKDDCFATRSWEFGTGVTYYNDVSMDAPATGNIFTKSLTITQDFDTGLAATCQATDQAGDPGTWGDAYPILTVGCQTSSPTFSSITADPDPAKAGSIEIAFTASATLASDPGVTLKNTAEDIQLGSASYVSNNGFDYIYSFTVAGTKDGVADITVSGQTTAAESCSIGSSIGEFNIDTQSPTVSVSHSPANPISSDGVAITAAGNDVNKDSYQSGMKEIKIYVGGVLKNTCTSSPCQYSSTYSPGTHNYYAVIEDNAGNLGRDPSTGTNSFTVAPPPTITSVSPAGGVINSVTAVTIKGSNFLATSTVTFNGVAATSINLVDVNTITTNTPVINAYGPVNVVVTNLDGQSHTLTDGFTYAHPLGRVFVTSGQYSGDLVSEAKTILSDPSFSGDGLDGGDAICQKLADDDTLGGTWKAWLSTSTVDAKDKIYDREYYRLSVPPNTVTTSLAELLNGAIDRLIDYDEKNTAVTISGVWTGTLTDGTNQGDSCNGWTDATSTFNGLIGGTGNNMFVNAGWTDTRSLGIPVQSCSGTLKLYCFETSFLPSPTVTSVSPSSGPNTGGTSITITGTNFIPNPLPQVFVGGRAATVTAATTISITATTPDGSFGVVDVKVINNNGLSGTRISSFTYILPLGKWKFDTSGQAEDTSGRGNNGQLGGTLTWSNTNCHSGGCYIFNGDDYIALPNFFNKQGEITELTAAAWVKTSASGGTWLSNWAFLDFDRSDYFQFYSSGDTGKIVFATKDTSGAVNSLNSNTKVNDGKWHFIAVVFDGTDKYIYLDGAEDGKAINPHGGLSIGTGVKRYGFIGDGSEASTFNGARNRFYYEGSMDEVILYNIALSQSEISALFGQ